MVKGLGNKVVLIPDFISMGILNNCYESGLSLLLNYGSQRLLGRPE